MRFSIYLFFVFTLFTFCLNAQNGQIDEYFRRTPGDIKLHNQDVQEYNVILKWQNLDAINGTRINCNAVTAGYRIGFANDYVVWNDVKLAAIDDFQQKDFTGLSLPTLDGFTYKAGDTAFLAENFYERIAPEHRDLAKWLVSDALRMQSLAWYVFDSLEYNKEFIPDLLKNYDVKFEDWVTFSSRYQKLLWSGISKHNDEICAVVKFESLYNPIGIENAQMPVRGRALYYGEMWISLEDKQVEYAAMVEDDIFRLRSSQFPDEQLIDLQRVIVFDKQKFYS